MKADTIILPSGFSHTEFLRMTDMKATTELEQALWDRLADAVGYDKFSGGADDEAFEGLSRAQLIAALRRIEADDIDVFSYF